MKPQMFLSLLVYLLTLSSIALSQDSSEKFTIVVKDTLGSLITNAEVLVTNTEKKEITKKTNKQGLVEFLKLPAGIYQVTIKSEGFETYINQELKLVKDEIKKIDVTLQILPVVSNVDVDNKDSTDLEDYGFVRIITKEEIENLPDDPAEFVKALRRLVGQSMTGEDFPIRVDGILGDTIPNKNLIEQIRIDQNTFSAKYDGTSGGGIQIYTKSKLEKITGSGNFGFADSRLNAKDPFLGDRFPSQSRNYNFSLGIPLGQKSSLNLSFSRNENDSSSVINAIVLDENLLTKEYKDIFPTLRRGNFFRIGFRSDIKPKHSISINYSFGKDYDSGSGVGNFSLPERVYKNENISHTLSTSHRYFGENDFVSESSFRITHNQGKTIADNDKPTINVSESFIAGGANSASNNQSLVFSANNDLEFKVKKTRLKIGAAMSGDFIRQDSRQNFNGTYFFKGRIAPVLDENNQPLFDVNGNPLTKQITSLESYRRTLIFQKLGYSAIDINRLGGGADQFTLTGGQPLIKVSQINYSLYAETDYKLTGDLGLSVGLRYQNQTNFSNPLNLSPNFSLIWSPKKKEKQKDLFALPRISVGSRLNFSNFGINNLLDVLQINDVNRGYYVVSMANAINPQLTAEILNSFPNTPSVEFLEEVSVPRSRRFYEDGFRPPYSFISNISVSKKLSTNWGIHHSLGLTKGFRNQISRNINAPLAGTFDPLNPQNALYPFDNLGSISQITSSGRSESIYFMTNLTIPEFKIFKYQLNINFLHRFNKSRSNTVSGSGLPFDPYDFSQEFAPTVNDGVHYIMTGFSQKLPFGLFMDLMAFLSSGARFNITTGRDTNGDGVYTERPAFATNPSKEGIVKTKYGYLDPNPTIGDVIIPRNFGRGPKNIGSNLTFRKSFQFNKDPKTNRGKQVLGFNAYVNNVFNINNKGLPIGNMSSPRFADILTGDSFNSSGGNPRSIRFETSFRF